MNGWDFEILWNAGRAVLEGTDPYSVPNFFYPLPVAYFFALFALFPYPVAFGLWLALNAALLVYFFRRLFWAWLLYAPVLHLFSSGQIELVLWSTERLIRPGWRGACCAALITLKPQTAIVLLPWHLFNWLRHDRPTLIKWGAATGALWLAPVLWRPRWLLEWRDALPPSDFLTSAGNVPGLFSIVKVVPDAWPLVMVAAAGVLLWGIWQSNPVARACALLAAPFGLFYSTFALLGTAPARLLVPLGLGAAALSILTRNFVPFMALPLAVIAWQRWAQTHGLLDAGASPDLPPGYIR